MGDSNIRQTSRIMRAPIICYLLISRTFENNCARGLSINNGLFLWCWTKVQCKFSLQKIIVRSKKYGNKFSLTNKWSEIKPVFRLSTNNLESDFVYGNNCQRLMQIMLTSTALFCIKFRWKLYSETTGLTEWKYLDSCKKLLFLPEQIFPAYFTEKKYRKGRFLGSCYWKKIR